MDKFHPNFPAGFLSYRVATAQFLYRFLTSLFFAALLVGTAAAAGVSRAHPISFGPSLSFSVADFDGDTKPDLASVQAGTSNALNTDYWIQLQLSAAGRQTFRIVAPVGGIQIASRDVNGDNALDLVLTSTWFGQPLAILLNDGHGSFTRQDPGAFPEAFSGSESNWASNTAQATDAIGAPPQSREDICSESKLFRHQRALARFAVTSVSRFGFSPCSISYLGRAPPLRSSAPLS